MDWFSNSYWCKISCHEYCTAHCSTLAVFLLRVPTSLQYVLFILPIILFLFCSWHCSVVFANSLCYLSFKSQFCFKPWFQSIWKEVYVWQKWRYVLELRSSVLFILGTLRFNDATATRTLLEMRICIKKKAQKEKSNFVVACFYSLIAKLGIFTLWSGKNRKEMYKKSVMHLRSCCFAY